jgi:chromosome segregation ATPase
VDPEQKALEFRGKLQEQKKTYSQLEAKLDSALKEMDKCKRENAALVDENRQMKRDMEDMKAKQDRLLKQAARDIDAVRNEKKNAEAEVQRMLEKESKSQKYMDGLAQDLRDIQDERRQLIKIIDRYSAGGVGPTPGVRERGGADDRARDRRSPDRRGYGDEGRDGRGRDRSRERRERSREREKRSPTTGAWRGDTGRLDGRVGAKPDRTLKQEDDGDM